MGSGAARGGGNGGDRWGRVRAGCGGGGNRCRRSRCGRGRGAPEAPHRGARRTPGRLDDDAPHGAVAGRVVAAAALLDHDDRAPLGRVRWWVEWWWSARAGVDAAEVGLGPRHGWLPWGGDGDAPERPVRGDGFEASRSRQWPPLGCQCWCRSGTWQRTGQCRAGSRWRARDAAAESARRPSPRCRFRRPFCRSPRWRHDGQRWRGRARWDAAAPRATPARSGQARPGRRDQRAEGCGPRHEGDTPECGRRSVAPPASADARVPPPNRRLGPQVRQGAGRPHRCDPRAYVDAAGGAVRDPQRARRRRLPASTRHTRNRHPHRLDPDARHHDHCTRRRNDAR